jgi:hypothetical protein
VTALAVDKVLVVTVGTAPVLRDANEELDLSTGGISNCALGDLCGAGVALLDGTREPGVEGGDMMMIMMMTVGSKAGNSGPEIPQLCSAQAGTA